MQDGAAGGTNPNIGILQVMLPQITEAVSKLGQHEAAIGIMQGQVKDAVVACQEAAHEIKFVSSSIPTPEACAEAHEKVAERVVRKLTPVLKANADGTVTAEKFDRRAFWPRDFLGWIKVAGIVVAFVWALVISGAWLSERGLLPGRDAPVAGIEVTAQPLQPDPLREEIRALVEHLKAVQSGPTSASDGPSWEMMGFGAATAKDSG